MERQFTYPQRRYSPLMKLLLRLALALALVTFCHGISTAADAPAGEGDGPHWKVRVEVLMVALPQNECLALLPDLRDSTKIDGAITKIMDLVGKKQAILNGYPVVQTLDGQRGVSESILEKRYATEYSPPEPPPALAPSDSSAPAPVPPPKANPRSVPSAMPSAFETRNMGVTLEVEPTVSKAGDTISLNLVPQRVDLLGLDYFDAGMAPNGQKIQISQPQFLTTKDTVTISVKSGEHLLVGVHPLVKPADYIEVFIVQAIATPIK